MIQARNNKWIELKLLADASSPTTLDPKLLQKSLRLFIDPNDKQACTRLGRNTLGVKLYAAGVEELQIATLQGWDVGSKMQRHYLSKDPAAVLPAMLQGAGFPANSPYVIPRCRVYPQLACPRVWRMLFPNESALGFLKGTLAALQKQLKNTKGMSADDKNKLQREAQEVDAAVEYLTMERELMATLLRNLPFYFAEYGAVLKDAPAEHGVVDGGGLGNVFFDVAVYIVETILGRGVPVDFKVVQDAGQDALEGCLVSLARSIVLKVPLAEQDDHGIRKLII